jgi:hypothetical protein
MTFTGYHPGDPAIRKGTGRSMMTLTSQVPLLNVDIGANALLTSLGSNLGIRA